MKNFKKGFVAPWLLALIAALVIGGGVYAYVHNKQSCQSATVQTSGLKTYTCPKYGFEFTYPATWSLTETKGNAGNGILLTPPHGEASDIGFDIYAIPKEKTLNINCQPVGSEDVNSIVDGFHSMGCKDLENANGVKYARGINAGMSTEQTYKEQILNAYFLTSQKSVSVQTLLVDDTGKSLPATAQIFDAILQSVKLTTQATSAQAPDSQTADWKTYTSTEYGFSFQYQSKFAITQQNSDDVIVRLSSGQGNADFADEIDVTKNLASACGKDNISSGKTYDSVWGGTIGGQSRSMCFIPQGVAISVYSATSGFTKSTGDSIISSFKFIN